jgi:hypothetical protein
LPHQQARKGDDTKGWLTPAQALATLDSVFKKNDRSKGTLLERLSGAMVRAIAESTTIARADYDDHKTATPILAPEWRQLEPHELSGFWDTGAFHYSRRSYGSVTDDQTVTTHFNVCFHPDDILEIVADPSKPTPVITYPTAVEAKNEEVQAKRDGNEGQKPVSPANLQAWFELYVKVYGGTPRDTVINAISSAKGMFPDRIVPRDSVRKLVQGRKPGRKSNQGGAAE